MSQGLPRPMKQLIGDLAKMPGIGTHSAKRITNYVLSASSEDINSLVEHIKEVRRKIKFCRICNNLSEGERCQVCSDNSRDESLICVVEQPSGVMAMEKSGAYKGLYHVLLGQISPIDGIGPEQIRIKGLLKRASEKQVKEVVIATDFNTEGETTALYVEELLKRSDVKVTRLARGVPAGASVEYADVATLQRALEERR